MSTPWSSIIAIKKRGDFDSLRGKISDVIFANSGNLDQAQQELLKLEEDAAERIIEENRPNIRKLAIESAISNIPCVPILNPASIFFGARDVRNEAKKAKNLNWFYVLHDIRNLTRLTRP